jgi:phospholipase/carboxylesterase
MRQVLSEYGGLATFVVDDLPAGVQPARAVVLCHGFGAPGDDLVPLATWLCQLAPGLAADTRFYFPQAPLRLDAYGMFGGRAWWLIDLEALNRAMLEGGFRRQARDDCPEGLPEARAALLEALTQICSESGLPMGRITLGGFSQGAMLSTDVAFHLKESPAGLILWSGTLLNEAEWKSRAAGRARLKVLQSHGRQDPLLPFSWAEYLRDSLTDMGLQVEFLPFDGPHTIPEAALARAAGLISGS